MRQRFVGWMALTVLASGAGAVPATAQASPDDPFAVTSRGRPLPRGERTVVVVTDSAPARPAADTARTPPRTPPPAAGATAATRSGGAGATTAPTPATPAPSAPRTTPPPRTGTTAAAAPRTHVVAYGETFYGIANRYGVTAAALRAANPGVDQERLVSGSTLRIPAATATEAPPATSSTRARSAPARRTHRVEPGESLWGIARRYDVSMEEIRRANDLEEDRVRIGQTLVIPEAD